MQDPSRDTAPSAPYTPVPGSSALRTRSRADSAEVVALEESERAIPVAREIAGEHLARTLVREGYVPVLTDVYDRLALSQEAPEQALYGHFYRLAIGDDRNFCRATKRDLMMRTRLSERRLLKALAGLVTKGHISLVHRDKRGTLYRVHLPHEVFREGAGDRVIIAGEKPVRRAARAGAVEADPFASVPLLPARAAPQAAERASVTSGDTGSALPPAAAPARPAPVLGGGSRAGLHDSLLECTTVASLAAAFCAAHGGPGRDAESVLEEILGRLEDGRTLAEVAEELVYFAKKAPKKVPVSELARFLERE